ncbi:MAG: hypothetical protein C5B49_01245 [Bdellovibrio sp.]|nr:MAG: hypothetical protein C5B49_01245 [Bdellovibrio sp.]
MTFLQPWGWFRFKRRSRFACIVALGIGYLGSPVIAAPVFPWLEKAVRINWRVGSLMSEGERRFFSVADG